MFAPPMFTPDDSQSGVAADLDLAFRICAIRETFEEVGILLGTFSLAVDSINLFDVSVY